MVKSKINIFSLIVVCLFFWPAQAQVTIDVAKITCKQFLTFAVTDPNNITLWLSGYYNGQRSNTVVEVQNLKARNAKKVQDYCIVNPNVPVMQAVETVLGKEK